MPSDAFGTKPRPKKRESAIQPEDNRPIRQKHFTTYCSVGPLRPTEMTNLLPSTESNANRFLAGAALIGPRIVVASPPATDVTVV